MRIITILTGITSALQISTQSIMQFSLSMMQILGYGRPEQRVCSDASFLLFMFTGYIKINHYYFNSKLLYKDLNMMWLFFENRNFNGHNLPFQVLTIAGRVECCGMKDRMVVAYGCRIKSQLINITTGLFLARLYNILIIASRLSQRNLYSRQNQVSNHVKKICRKLNKK